MDVEKVFSVQLIKYESDTCPVCNGELEEIECDLAVYGRGRNEWEIKDYITIPLPYCGSCHHYFSEQDKIDAISKTGYYVLTENYFLYDVNLSNLSLLG